MNFLNSVFAFAFGLTFGSFLNVCIYRIPLALPDEEPGESALRSILKGIAGWRAVNVPARSFCPACRHEIAWYDNLPVLSWFWLLGRCRHCGAPIRFRYLAVELLTGTFFLIGYSEFGRSLITLKFWIFSFLILALIFTDAEHRLLPDAFTVPGFFAGLGFSLLIPVHDFSVPYLLGRIPISNWRLLSLVNSLTGAVLASAFVFAAGGIYRILRGHEGMGFGDVKMMAFVGAFLGIALSVFTIFAGSLMGTICGAGLLLRVWIKRWRRRIRREPYGQAGKRAWSSAQLVRYIPMPFGSFLGAGALIAAFAGNALFRWYWHWWMFR